MTCSTMDPRRWLQTLNWKKMIAYAEGFWYNCKLKTSFFKDRNLGVLTKPLGFIRIIQLVASVVAFVTTVVFEAVSVIGIRCWLFEKDVYYKIGFPFKMDKIELRAPERCNSISNLHFKTYTIPFDFSNSAEFYVAVGVLTLILTTGMLFVYVFMHRLYSTNPVTPHVDLIITAVLSILWFVGSFLFAQTVSYIKQWTNPTHLFQYLDICRSDNACLDVNFPDFIYLDVSLIFGYVNCVLWISSLWLICKEAGFHKRIMSSSKADEQETPPLPEKDIVP